MVSERIRRDISVARECQVFYFLFNLCSSVYGLEIGYWVSDLSRILKSRINHAWPMGEAVPQ